MSRVLRPLKFKDPGSLTTCAPLCFFASQTQNAAPSGSVKTAVRPASAKSKGSTTTPPPAWWTLAAASSALATETYVFHTARGAGVGFARIHPARDGVQALVLARLDHQREPREPRPQRLAFHRGAPRIHRASVGGGGCVLRAPGGPVDLDRYALRGGPRVDQFKRCVRAGVGE